MTREDRIRLFAQELYKEGFKSTDSDEIRYGYILTPYESEIVITELKRLENESK